MMRGHYSIFNAIDAGTNLWGGLAYNSGSQLSYTPKYWKSANILLSCYRGRLARAPI